MAGLDIGTVTKLLKAKHQLELLKDCGDNLYCHDCPLAVLCRAIVDINDELARIKFENTYIIR